MDTLVFGVGGPRKKVGGRREDADEGDMVRVTRRERSLCSRWTSTFITTDSNGELSDRRYGTQVRVW